MSKYQFTNEEILAGIKKGREGWKGEITVPSKEFPGRFWEIHTFKTYKGISSYAQLGDYKAADKPGGFSSFSFIMFQDPSLRGKVIPAKCTEKNIFNAHTEFLLVEFNELIAAKFPTQPVTE